MTEQQLRIFSILRATAGPLTCAQIAAQIGDNATVSSIATQISMMRRELPEGAIMGRPGSGGVWLVDRLAEPRGCEGCGKPLSRRDSVRCLGCARGEREQVSVTAIETSCNELWAATNRLFERQARKMGCDVTTAALRLHGHAA